MMRPADSIQFTKHPYIEDNEPRRIESIKFSMFSGAEISKIAEVDVYLGKYYDPQKKPFPNGLVDPRMCCSRILLPEKQFREYLKKMRNPKLDVLQKTDLKKKIVKMCGDKTEVKCLRCGYVNGIAWNNLQMNLPVSKVKKGKTQLAIVHNGHKWDKDDGESRTFVPSVINPLDALLLFKKMQDQDCELLYLNDRPEKLIMTTLAVPPMALRPSVITDARLSQEDDITERLKRIIQANACLQQGMQEPRNSSIILDDWDYLQVEAAQFVNSDVRVASQAQQPARPLHGLVQRLKGKQGRFRGNLSGKRVEFTGRTVISPDPNLKITEVAVPLLMASILTYPEHVNRHNIEKLKQCVRNGPKKYPGAKFVQEPNGDRKDLSFSSRKRIADELKVGDVVHRHLEDGDIVLFNRQPSLHRMSIMCHRARIMPWRTLRFNESVCNPYNADFDGDEMNTHVPQTEEARTEALMLMGVQNNLCTPKNGAILVASTQDFLTSSYQITRRDTFYDRARFSVICSYMGDGMDMIDLPTPALIKVRSDVL
ncbi:hypothetical protein Cgig2_025584 [Carnegiea gigantea]|uniref:DNA-directed RNA polymerase subunit n=1 Tax=Carnegiea gigantea TaxID=171969 RepID=A0A9Q1GLW1_9CARY|nr:hypothetical protein Cgig2_025584 [Carnegiea gigantea]